MLSHTKLFYSIKEEHAQLFKCSITPIPKHYKVPNVNYQPIKLLSIYTHSQKYIYKN